MTLLRFTKWVLGEIIEKAETEWYSPETIEREMLELQKQFEAHEISAAYYHEQEQHLFERLLEGRERGIGQ